MGSGVDGKGNMGLVVVFRLLLTTSTSRLYLPTRLLFSSIVSGTHENPHLYLARRLDINIGLPRRNSDAIDVVSVALLFFLRVWVCLKVRLEVAALYDACPNLIGTCRSGMW